jgi:CHAT domain-containing protein
LKNPGCKQFEAFLFAVLMTEFYTNLYQKKLDQAQALRQAVLKVKEQYPNKPRNWAAFTLLGESK